MAQNAKDLFKRLEADLESGAIEAQDIENFLLKKENEHATRNDYITTPDNVEMYFECSIPYALPSGKKAYVIKFNVPQVNLVDLIAGFKDHPAYKPAMLEDFKEFRKFYGGLFRRSKIIIFGEFFFGRVFWLMKNARHIYKMSKGEIGMTLMEFFGGSNYFLVIGK